jgi:hypothetical protein
LVRSIVPKPERAMDRGSSTGDNDPSFADEAATREVALKRRSDFRVG